MRSRKKASVGSEADLMRHANPVSPDEADAWMATERARATYRRLMEAVGSDAAPLGPHRGTPDSARAPWQVALVAVVVVLAVAAVPFWLLGPGRHGADSVSTQVPVEIGIAYVWPDGGWPGSAADVATAFATEVLGWPDVTPVPDLQADPDGPVWVRLLAPNRQELSMLTVPLAAGDRAVLQIGTPPSIELSAAGDGDGPWIALRPLLGAVTADVSIRLLDEPDAIGWRLDAAELDGRVDQPDLDPRLIATVLVRYRDAAGAVIAAAGGRYATEPPLDEALTPDEILSDGVVTRAEYTAAAEAVVDCLRSRGVEAGVGVNATGTPSYTTSDSDDPEGQNLANCLGEHVGRVELVWANQNAPSPEREIEFYNDVVDCVEVHTGDSYGDVGAVGDHKATDAAIAAAGELYDECFTEILPRYPDVGPMP